MLVEEAGVDDQTAINFAVITEVIVDTSRVVAETLVLPLTEQTRVLRNTSTNGCSLDNTPRQQNHWLANLRNICILFDYRLFQMWWQLLEKFRCGHFVLQTRLLPGLSCVK